MEFYFNIGWKKGNKETRELCIFKADDNSRADMSIHETGSGKFKRIEFYNDNAEIMWAEALSVSGDTFKVKFSLKDLGFAKWNGKEKSWEKA